MLPHQKNIFARTCDRLLNEAYFTNEDWIQVMTQEWEEECELTRKEEEPLSDPYAGKFLRVLYRDTKQVCYTKSGRNRNYFFRDGVTGEEIRKTIRNCGWNWSDNLVYDPKVSKKSRAKRTPRNLKHTLSAGVEKDLLNTQIKPKKKTAVQLPLFQKGEPGRVTPHMFQQEATAEGMLFTANKLEAQMEEMQRDVHTLREAAKIMEKSKCQSTKE